MNTLKHIATPLIAVAMMTVPMMALAQSSQQGNATDNNAATANAPADTAQAKAFHDGEQAATTDTVVLHRADAKKSYLYVNPPVKKDARDEYRAAFTAGYQARASQGATGVVTRQ